MARFVSGDVVVVPFPFTDLSSSKVRPALVVASFTRGDFLLYKITSQNAGHPDAIELASSDFQASGLSRKSFVLPHRLVTVNENCVRRAVARPTSQKLEVIRERICETIRRG